MIPSFRQSYYGVFLVVRGVFDHHTFNILGNSKQAIENWSFQICVLGQNDASANDTHGKLVLFEDIYKLVGPPFELDFNDLQLIILSLLREHDFVVLVEKPPLIRATSRIDISTGRELGVGIVWVAHFEFMLANYLQFEIIYYQDVPGALPRERL